MGLTIEQLIAELEKVRDLAPESQPVILHIGRYALLEGTIQNVYFEYGNQEVRINVRLSDDSIHDLNRQGFQITQEKDTES